MRRLLAAHGRRRRPCSLSAAPGIGRARTSVYACTVGGHKCSTTSRGPASRRRRRRGPRVRDQGHADRGCASTRASPWRRAVAGLTFTSPAGTAITDFALERQLDYNSPVVKAPARSRSRCTSSAPSCSPAPATTTTPSATPSTPKELVRLPVERGARRPRARHPRQLPGARGLQERQPHAADPRRLRRRHGVPVGPGGRVYHVVYGAAASRSTTSPRPLGLRRGGRAAVGRGARRLRPGHRHGRRQRRHPTRRDRRRHRPGRPERRRLGELRRRRHLRGGRAEDRPRVDVLVPARQALPRPRAGRPSGPARSRSGAAPCSCAWSTPAATPSTAARTPSTWSPRRTAARPTAATQGARPRRAALLGDEEDAPHRLLRQEGGHPRAAAERRRAADRRRHAAAAHARPAPGRARPSTARRSRPARTAASASPSARSPRGRSRSPGAPAGTTSASPPTAT